MKGDYQPVIGLEVHAELATASKLFCGCSTTFGAPPNTQTCPVCLGLPGVLPVVNRKAVEYAIRLSLALNCRINRFNKFDRKNYYYPDLPKNYQISQNYLPLAEEGWVEITVKGETKKIGIGNIHLEEDAGKNLHTEDTGIKDASLVDYNRAGIPLLEIVSKPDMNSLEEVEEYMTTLRDILLYTEVSDCKMEEGSLRFEANISLRPRGTNQLGPRVEMKNLNSFRIVLKALEYEMERQSKVLEEGGRVRQETRLWNEERGISLPMRYKEEAQDYRYFPEPDLPPLLIKEKWIEEVRRTLPELPHLRRRRIVAEYKIPEYDAMVLTQDRELADYFEECVKLYPHPKKVSNWIMGLFLQELKGKGIRVGEVSFSPRHLGELLQLIDKGTISGNMAKEVFLEMFRTGKGAEEIVKEKGLSQISDEKEISAVVEKVISENPQAVEDLREGKEKALGFLVGQVMRLTRGKANPQLVNKIIREKLASGE